jgi:galactokinase
MSEGTAVRFRAPGRVNLIGGHVDHHDGLVVAMAIDLGIVATARSTTARSTTARSATARRDQIVVSSAGFDGEVRVPADGSADPTSIEPRWGRLVGGVARALAERDLPAAGFVAELDSDLPVGGGLSSSAAFEVLVAMVATELASAPLAPIDLIDVAQRAEHLAMGVPCGIQDQTSIVVGGVVLLDVRDRSVEALDLPAGTTVVVVDSAVPRHLEATPFAARRAEALDAARRLGVTSLRDATPEQVADVPVARHVVSEIDRVARFADALRSGDVETAGRLMAASHRSSRDDYGSSTPELDRLVDELLAAGAHGARLTGGGYGGCVVALVADDAAEAICDEVVERYRTATGLDAASARVLHPARGAGRI